LVEELDRELNAVEEVIFSPEVEVKVSPKVLNR
jgi:hypothetical protein